jgi:integrase
MGRHALDSHARVTRPAFGVQGRKIEPPIQFRQLRTTYGSLLLNADAPLSTISELLGHKDTRMTRRHYAHLLSEKLKETVDERLPSFA